MFLARPLSTGFESDLAKQGDLGGGLANRTIGRRCSLNSREHHRHPQGEVRNVEFGVRCVGALYNVIDELATKDLQTTVSYSRTYVGSRATGTDSIVYD